MKFSVSKGTWLFNSLCSLMAIEHDQFKSSSKSPGRFLLDCPGRWGNLGRLKRFASKWISDDFKLNFLMDLIDRQIWQSCGGFATNEASCARKRFYFGWPDDGCCDTSMEPLCPVVVGQYTPCGVLIDRAVWKSLASARVLFTFELGTSKLEEADQI